MVRATCGSPLRDRARPITNLAVCDVTEAKQLTIKLVRSPIGHPQRQKATLQALGLRKINQAVVHTDTPQIRGMINRVQHLVEVSPS